MESHRSDAMGVQPPRHRPATAKHAMRSAGTRADTISLLTWAAGQVEERRAEADRWREPRPTAVVCWSPTMTPMRCSPTRPPLIWPQGWWSALRDG
jgi:hypothetical protein